MRTLVKAARVRTRPGFTLVEVLMVIAIIGVLVGLLVPVVNIALNAAKKRAIAMEVTTIANAVEQYRQKYGDLPPDGSSSVVMTRHFRKVFPQIASSELALLSPPLVNTSTGAPLGVMDPPEALVFFLGGFSSDPVYPLSGPGGPFFIVNAAGVQVNSSEPAASRSVQYNPDRNEPLYEFKQPQLTLEVTGGVTLSTDEALLFGPPLNVNDVLPVYVPSGKTAPFVYFDHRTYSYASSAGAFYNHYTPTGIGAGAARPYRSDDVRTTVAATPANADAYYRYMNEDGFQIQSAGLDDSYGGIPFVPGSGGGPVFFRFPSGDSIDFGRLPGAMPAVGDLTAYANTSGVSTQLDNATNFSEGVLGDSLDNSR